MDRKPVSLLGGVDTLLLLLTLSHNFLLGGVDTSLSGRSRGRSSGWPAVGGAADPSAVGVKPRARELA